MLTLDHRSGLPLYEQIKQSVIGLIVNGALSEGEALPSVRELAGSLSINPNTIARAYRDLESEGYIFSVQGKGNFVQKSDQALKNRREQLLGQFKKTSRELLLLGAKKTQLTAIIEEETCHD